MTRRPQPTSSTAAPLALDHSGDHDSGVRLQWMPSRVHPVETLPRALMPALLTRADLTSAQVLPVLLHTL